MNIDMQGLDTLHQDPYPIQTGMLAQLCEWLHNGNHVAVIGLTGSRRRSLIDDVIRLSGRALHFDEDCQSILTILPVDMVNLQEVNEQQLYRLVLRTLLEQRGRFDNSAETRIAQLNHQYLQSSDSFTLQSVLRTLLDLICQPDAHIVFVFERFDDVCKHHMTGMASALSSLLAGFEDRTSLLLGIKGSCSGADCQGAQLELHRTLGARPIWTGGLTSAETRTNLRERLHSPAPTEHDFTQIIALTGGYPSLIDAVVEWWGESFDRDDNDAWFESIYEYLDMQTSLHQIWDDLTFAERRIIYDFLTIKPRQYPRFTKANRNILNGLYRRGLLLHKGGQFELFSPIFARFATSMRHTLRGRVWFNDVDDTFYQGEMPLTQLSPRAEAALEFFLRNPYKKCDKDQLIYHIWESPHVTDDSVYQVIRELRRYLEQDTRKPAYILNHRSLRGGRYQFFPEGRDNYSMLPYQNRQPSGD